MPTIELTVGHADDSVSFGDANFHNVDPYYWLSAEGVWHLARFTGVTIPQGSTINSAIVTAWSYNGAGAGAANYVTVGLEQVDNAARASDAATAWARRTNRGSTLNWAVTNDGVGQPQPSPDLASLLQAVVDRSGWSSGNAIMFFMQPTSAPDYAGTQLHTFYTGTPPQIVIDYTEPDEPEPEPPGGGDTSTNAAYSVRDGGAWVGSTFKLRVDGAWSTGGVPTGGGSDGTYDNVGGLGSLSTSTSTYPIWTPITSGTYYVDAANGNDSNSGTSLGAAFATIEEGLSHLGAGDTLLVRGGTYFISELNRSTGWASETTISAYGTERPILDASGVGANNSAINFQAGASNETWHGFHIKNVPDNGGQYDGQGIRGEGASNITLSGMWVSHSAQSGIWFANCSDMVVKDCAAWRLGDGFDTSTNAPDGMVATGFDSGTRCDNVQFVRCFVAHAPDDGYDFYRAVNSRYWDSVCFECGNYWNGNPGGDGNGFKIGSPESGVGESNTAQGCISVYNRSNGVDGNQGDHIDFLRNTSYGNGGLGFDCNGDNAAEDGLVRNNIALNNGTNRYVGANPTQVNNTWNLGINNAGFYNTSNYDFSLTSGSPCVGAAHDGGNLGASEAALRVLITWANRDLT